MFESNPELAEIGSKQLYSQYLDSIGITDIAYHHSEEDISEFTSSSERYFQKELKKKNKYIPKLDDIVFLVKKPLTEEFMSKRKFIGSWGLKTPKTLQFSAGEKIGEGVHPGIDEGIFAGIEGNYDAIDFGRIRDNKTWSEVIAITNPNNAVKLGSKQDIEGFKDFVEKNNKKQTVLSPYDMFSYFKQQRDAAVGKDDVGISANGLKSFFALSTYYNDYYKNNFIKDSNSIRKSLKTFKKSFKFIDNNDIEHIFDFATISDVQINEEQELFSKSVLGDFTVLKSMSALSLSAFTSAATD